jgi:hypothetical protein
MARGEDKSSWAYKMAREMERRELEERKKRELALWLYFLEKENG